MNLIYKNLEHKYRTLTESKHLKPKKFDETRTTNNIIITRN